MAERFYSEFIGDGKTGLFDNDVSRTEPIAVFEQAPQAALTAMMFNNRLWFNEPISFPGDRDMRGHEMRKMKRGV